MQLTLGLSPCPNDTFIFDALIHHKIDTEGLQFKIFLEDVEVLNRSAFCTELDITKLSFHAYMYVLDQYILLRSGNALGFGVGPLLIANTHFILDDLLKKNNLRIGIPGEYTTANFLLTIAAPQLKNRSPMLFSSIEQALLDHEIDLGLIIHENRFTYQTKGLKKIIDLGQYWEKLTGCAIPLGGIMIKRYFSDAIKQKVNRVIRRSIEFAFENPKSSLNFVTAHAQEMDEHVLYQHIALYVNKYTVDLEDVGQQAVSKLFEQAIEAKMISASCKDLFLSGLSLE